MFAVRSIGTLAFLFALLPAGAAGQDVSAGEDVVDPCAEAVSMDPQWAWLGAISGRPARELTRRSLEGVSESVLSRAMQQLRRAMVRTPVCPADAVALAALSTALQDRLPLREAREALADRVEEAPDDAVAHLWLARAAAAAGSPDALRFAQAAITAGADQTGAALAAARAAFANGQDAIGTNAYFQGLQAVTDGDGLGGYVGDLGPIIRRDEGDEFYELDAEGQARWLARFWLDRAAESGVTVQERLSEHYRRVRAAYEDYCGSCLLGPVAGPIIPYGRVGMGLDERGLVFMSQGEPDVAVSTEGNELPPNLSWGWNRGGRQLAVHFAIIDRRSGWQIMEDPLALVNPTADPLALDEPMPDRAGVRTCVVDGCEGRYVRDFYVFLIDRGDISPRFRTLANQYRSRPGDWGENAVSGFIVGGPLSGQPSFRFEAEEDLEEIRARDQFLPGLFDVDGLALRVVPFRDAAGAERTYLAIDGSLPDSAPAVGRVDATLVGDEDDAVIRGSATATTAAGSWSAPIEAGRGERSAMVVVREGAGETDPILASVRASVDFEAVTSPGPLALSGLVVWAGDEGAAGVGRDVALGRLSARPTLTAGRPASVYFEVYDLPPDQAFETRIRIERAEDGGLFRRLQNLFGGDDPSELRVPGESGGPDPVRERSLSLTLPDLGPGLYRLEVEVRYRLVQTSRMVEFRVVEGG